jgi:sugar (pentulose or hexulose) kinase
MDMSRLGIRPGGVLFPVPLTFNEPSRGQIARAGLEAVAYAVRANLEQAQAVAGAAAELIAVGGGMTKTAAWVDLIADVLGRPTHVLTPNVSALGAYVCAATARGDFSSLEEGATEVSRGARVIEPDVRAAAEYTDHYQDWLGLAERLHGGE